MVETTEKIITGCGNLDNSILGTYLQARVVTDHACERYNSELQCLFSIGKVRTDSGNIRPLLEKL